jgi:hypothetical protein
LALALVAWALVSSALNSGLLLLKNGRLQARLARIKASTMNFRTSAFIASLSSVDRNWLTR